jgi:hypothetical protein
MKTIPLPDNFPSPKYQIGQQVLVPYQGESVPGSVMGLFFVSDRVEGYAPGWLYFVSFLAGLPNGVWHLLSETNYIAHETELDAA